MKYKIYIWEQGKYKYIHHKHLRMEMNIGLKTKEEKIKKRITQPVIQSILMIELFNLQKGDEEVFEDLITFANDYFGFKDEPFLGKYPKFRLDGNHKKIEAKEKKLLKEITENIEVIKSKPPYKY